MFILVDRALFTKYFVLVLFILSFLQHDDRAVSLTDLSRYQRNWKKNKESSHSFFAPVRPRKTRSPPHLCHPRRLSYSSHLGLSSATKDGLAPYIPCSTARSVIDRPPLSESLPELRILGVATHEIGADTISDHVRTCFSRFSHSY